MTDPTTIDTFLHLLIQRGGSDLHIRSSMPPWIRVDGGMLAIDYVALSEEHVWHLLTPITNEEQEAEFERTNELDFGYNCAAGRFRVNVFRERGGIGAVFRAIPNSMRSLEELGAPPSVRRLAMFPHGLVLVTGATGHGKSTTLASLIDYINTNSARHILTIEDPIEFVHEPKMSLVSQREVKRDTHSFQNALRAALREDPDVVLVGEMRDYETASLGCTLAETGHLVFATLHTPTAAKAIDRIVDIFPSDGKNQIRIQLADTLRAVVTQKLLPKVGGGRIAAFEVMMVTPAIANLIRDGKVPQIQQAMQTGRDAGMQTMEASLKELLANNLITEDVYKENAARGRE